MVDYGNIPQELKQKRQWVLANNQKMPINPKTYQAAKSNDDSTWGTYEECMDALKTYPSYRIGFVFNNDYIGVDLDDCWDDDKKAKPWAKEILQKLSPAYMEYSISGDGCHVLLPRTTPLPGKGLNINFQKRGLHGGIGGLEMYESGRYFVMTGNLIKKSATTITADDTIISNAIEIYIKHKNIDDRADENDKRSKTTNKNDVFWEAKANVDIHRIISDYGFKVDRSGKIPCPFHNEKEASLKVYDDSYYCFGCQEYGDSITFVRKMDNLSSNYEAVKKIAEKYHLSILDTPQITSNTSNTITNTTLTDDEKDEALKKILAMALNVAEVEPYNPDNAEIVNSGIPSLDKKIGGFELGLTTLWTGINGAGKSTVLGQTLIEAVEQGRKVFAFSGELMAHKFQYWIDKQTAGTPYLKAKVSDKTKRTYYAVDEFAKKKIHAWYKDKLFLYDNKNGMKFDTILEVMKAYAEYKDAKVFLVDNLMRLDLKGLDKDTYEAQSRFMNSICDFAQTYKVHVHVVAHPRKIHGSIISKSDVSGSGDLTNRADNVLAVHRATEQYKAELSKFMKKSPALQLLLNADNVLEIFKCRESGITEALIPLSYMHDCSRIVDYTDRALASKVYGFDQGGQWLNMAVQQTIECPF